MTVARDWNAFETGNLMQPKSYRAIIAPLPSTLTTFFIAKSTFEPAVQTHITSAAKEPIILTNLTATPLEV